MMLSSQFQINKQEEIVIVTIDDQSIKELETWPWPRKYHAELISKLNEAGAKVIAFDILFQSTTEYDNILAEEIEEADNVILPYKLDLKAYRATFDFDYTRYKIDNIQYPKKEFKENAAELGYLNLLADHEGTIRRVHLLGDDTIKSFALSLAEKYSSKDKDFKNDELLINFKAQQNYFQQISYSKVLKGEYPRGIFKNKIILVGAKGNSFQDYLATPLATIKGYIPGVMIHAAIIDNYLEDSFIKKLDSKLNLFFLLILSLLSAGVYYKLRPRYNSLITIIALIALSIINLIFFINYNLFIPLLPTFFVIIINLIVSLLNWYLKVESRKEKLRNIFSRYLAPEIISEVLQLSDKDYLAGNRREITVLFVDINSFTTYSEDNPPGAVVELLNNYFSIITEETFNREGTLDKFLGDGAMIFFNAPTKQSDHADKAINLAINLQNKINNNSNLPLSVSIGINTGLAVVGNIGSTTRSDYTAIGDVVNTAARIEKITAAGEICIGENTYQQIKNSYQAQLERETNLRGKSKRESIYKIIY